MTRTAKQIQHDVYSLLRDSTLNANISGDVYRNGMRPRDSCKEDAVVSFTTGTTGQIQTGIVTVNIFVPDIDPWQNGTWVEDGRRTEEIETLAQEWVDDLAEFVTDYHFELQHAIYTESEPEIRQHFIVVRIIYKLLD